MMVSVIIPTYNRHEFLRDAVVSVLDQHYMSLELIVVDDGSEDDTASVVAEFGERVRCLSMRHGGVSAARNAGIVASRGRWVAFLDSDDLWLRDKLRAQMDFLKKNPSCRICQTGEVWIRDGRRVNPRRYHEKPEGLCFERLLARCLVSPSAVVMERSLLDEVGMFDEEMPACEDYDLWLRIGCEHPIGLVREPLVIKRGGHPDQLSRSVSNLDLWRIRALAKIVRAGRLSETQRQQALGVLRDKCKVYGEGCLKRGRREEGQHFLTLPDRLAVEFACDMPVSGSEGHAPTL